MRQRGVLRFAAMALGCLALLAACGGGGGGAAGSTPPVTPPVVAVPTRAQAAAFLRQASFGPNVASMDRVVQVGYERWIDEQMALPASLQLPYLKSLSVAATQDDRVEAWLRFALKNDDQLRQRVAFALSEIFVVSERGALSQFPLALANYHDMLSRRAFGNFRDLLADVTLNPAMGVYLSMLGNIRPDLVRNIRPDENYARELLQLFSIGLVELNNDGSVKLNAQNQPIPTYDQAVVEGFAHVFTGWTFGGTTDFTRPSFDYEQPMTSFDILHDAGAKLVLRGVTLPPGRTARQDLDAALDSVFAHPNVGPFICRQLIQRLTSSNPSPAYVARVVAKFNDNGAGLRGDLAAVVKAILLDAEARTPPASGPGKLSEPLLRLTSLWRAFPARSNNGRYYIRGLEFLIEQAPLRAASVFNFFRPDYAPPGEMRTLNLVSPEMQIATETTSANLANLLAFATFAANSRSTNLKPEDIYIDISAEEPLAADAARLVDQVADKLAGGGISQNLRAEVIAMVERLPANAPAARVAEAIHDIVTSPEYAVQP